MRFTLVSQGPKTAFRNIFESEKGCRKGLAGPERAAEGPLASSGLHRIEKRGAKRLFEAPRGPFMGRELEKL